jgi:hypothetical protein
VTGVLIAPGIVEAVNAGDRLALHALADEYEAAGHPLAHGLRRIAQGDRTPSTWEDRFGGVSYSWVRYTYANDDRSATMRLHCDLFGVLKGGRPVNLVSYPEVCYARDYDARLDAYLDLAQALLDPSPV